MSNRKLIIIMLGIMLTEPISTYMVIDSRIRKLSETMHEVVLSSSRDGLLQDAKIDTNIDSISRIETTLNRIEEKITSLIFANEKEPADQIALMP